MIIYHYEELFRKDVSLVDDFVAEASITEK
jgi:hypothetical protein